MTIQITTPKPPLTLYESVSVPIADTWTVVYEVPQWNIPANGQLPGYTQDIAVIVSSLVVTNTSSGSGLFDLKISTGTGGQQVDRTLVVGKAIDAGDWLRLTELDRFVMLTNFRLQAKAGVGETGIAHLSFIQSTRERFTVIE